MNETWNTNIDEIIVKPIAKKAIDLYAEELLKQDEIKITKEVDGYIVNLIKNPILKENFFINFIFPEVKEMEYMVNVEVKIKNSWHVGIHYKNKNGEWIEKSKLKKLTTYTEMT